MSGTILPGWIRMSTHGPKHFAVQFDRPGRIEVSVTDEGTLLAEVYEGSEIDHEQDPLFAYGSDLPELQVEGGAFEYPAVSHRWEIRRFVFDENDPRYPYEVVKTVDTLAEAQEWCQRDDTHGPGWFDGYAGVG